MLEQLRDHLDEMEQDFPESHAFVERLLIEYEETGKVRKLSTKQFKWLNDLHQRYC